MSVIDTPLRFSHNASMATVDEITAELIRRLEAKEFKGKDIAALLNTQQARISEIKNQTGKRRLSAHEADILAEFFGMEGTSKPSTNVVEIPVISIAAAGSWAEAAQLPIYTIKLADDPGINQAFAVEVKGDSMDRFIQDGFWAVIDPTQTRLYDGHVYLISNHDFEGTIKRYRTNPARFEPDSHNPTHQPIFADEHQIKVVGRVVNYGGRKGLCLE